MTRRAPSCSRPASPELDVDFDHLELRRIEAVLADFWTSRFLSSSSRGRAGRREDVIRRRASLVATTGKDARLAGAGVSSRAVMDLALAPASLLSKDLVLSPTTKIWVTSLAVVDLAHPSLEAAHEGDAASAHHSSP